MPYQELTVYAFRNGKRDRAFFKLPTLFSRTEVPQGCCVELAADVFYIGNCLKQEGNSGWWNLFYVAQLMKISTCLLQDVYDTYRFWALA